MTIRWTDEEIDRYLHARKQGPKAAVREIRKIHKYRAEPAVVDGIRFDSKLEARYYERLKLRQAAGEVVGFLRQVPIHLPGKTKLVVDFLEFRSDGSAVFVDTKGVETEAFRLKLRQVRELYPWAQIEIVRKVS